MRVGRYVADMYIPYEHTTPNKTQTTLVACLVDDVSFGRHSLLFYHALATSFPLFHPVLGWWSFFFFLSSMRYPCGVVGHGAVAYAGKVARVPPVVLAFFSPRPDRFPPFLCRALPATLPIIQQKKDTKMCRWLFVAAVLWMPVVSLSPLPTARGRGGKTGHTRRGHHSRSFHLHSYYKAPKRKIIVKPKIHAARRDSFLYSTK